MQTEKDKQSDELFKRIREELTVIMNENASNDPERKISYEMLMKPSPLPRLTPSVKESNQKTKSTKKLAKFQRQQVYRQAVGGKSITMKPTQERSSGGQSTIETSSSRGSSATSLKNTFPTKLGSMQFTESANVKSMDEDLKKMQLELDSSYKLFQGIGEKFDSINFEGLKTRIRDLHLDKVNNELGKATTAQLQQLFEASYMQNHLDKLTEKVSDGFRRHPGEFGDIPELSTFFKACAQLEHGLDTLKQQRKRSNELEKRLCWATEIAYDRMEEIRNSVGDKPETNF